MTQQAPPAAAHSEWKRLHPMSPVVRFGRVLLGLLVVVLPSLEAGRRRGGGEPPVFTSFTLWAVLVGVSVAAGVVSWLVTRWRLSGQDLQIETGLIRRQSFRIPLARIQAVDIVAPLSARILGLAEVRVVSAGRGGERGRLAYLPADEAVSVRARLLALAHGLSGETPEPPAQPLQRVDNGQLVLALSLRGPTLTALILLVAALVMLVVAPRLGAATISASLSGIIAIVLSVGRTFNEEFDFAISEAGDGLRLDRGLLQKRHETIPFGRIQAIRVVQPLLWRPAGWLRLEVDVARQHGVEHSREDPSRVARTLLPVGTRWEATALLARIFPEAGIDPPPQAHPPRRAMLKAPLSYHFLRAWYGSRYVYARTGRLQSATVIVPLQKIQSVRLTSGPVQRRLRLATVHIDTAGQRWTATARCRDQQEAAQILWEVTRRARLKRRRLSTAAVHAGQAGLPAPGIA